MYCMFSDVVLPYLYMNLKCFLNVFDQELQTIGHGLQVHGVFGALCLHGDVQCRHGEVGLRLLVGVGGGIEVVTLLDEAFCFTVEGLFFSPDFHRQRERADVQGDILQIVIHCS